jgi:hypothetical protein
MRRRPADEKARLAPRRLPHPPVARMRTCYHIFPDVRIGECVDRNKAHAPHDISAIANDHEYPCLRNRPERRNLASAPRSRVESRRGRFTVPLNLTKSLRAAAQFEIESLRGLALSTGPTRRRSCSTSHSWRLVLRLWR